MSSHVIYGKFGKLHGNRGEIRIWPFNADTDGLKPGTVLLCSPSSDETLEVTVRTCRTTDKCLLVTLDGLKFRDQLDPLTNCEIKIDRSALPELSLDEFYHSDIEGLEVFQMNGETRELIGKVTGFLDLPSQYDVMAVEGPRFDGRLLVMWKNDLVLSVSLTDGIVVAPVETWAPADFELKPA